MSIDTIVDLARTRYATLMQDTCTIRRKVATTTNQVDGRVTYQWNPVYSGACRVQQVGPGGNMSGAPGSDPGGAGEASNQIVSYILQLPVDTSLDISPDDVATVTCTHDAALVGRKLRVQGLARASHKTSRRLSCVEVA